MVKSIEKCEKVAPIFVAEAVRRFGCTSWADLLSRPALISDSRALAGSAADARLLPARPCRLTECDAFLSHSWHDSRRVWKKVRKGVKKY